MDYDPEQMAWALVEHLGLDEARREVMVNVMKAQEDADLFALSVWRDVKRVLAQLAAKDQHAA